MTSRMASRMTSRMISALGKPLRLLARNADDFHILSGLLQGALLSSESIRWNKRAARFSMRLERLCWECNVDQPQPWRTASELSLVHVAKATHKGLAQASEHPITLLACECIGKESLRFLFSGGAVLHLTALSSAQEQGLPRAYLTDIGEKFVDSSSAAPRA